MNRILFLCTLLATLIPPLHSELIFKMDLIEFSNPLNNTYTNRPCTSKGGSCQTGFLFCLVDLPFRNPQSCSLGDHVTASLGGNHIQFEAAAANRTQNFSFQFRFAAVPPQGMGMMIEVRDYYEKSRWDSIDFYTSTLADVPLSPRSANATYAIIKRFSSLFKHNSSLTVRAQLSCAPSFFGSNCEVFCNEEETAASNCHYTCDVFTGARVCKNDFFGPDCQTRKLFLSL